MVTQGPGHTRLLLLIGHILEILAYCWLRETSSNAALNQRVSRPLCTSGPGKSWEEESRAEAHQRRVDVTLWARDVTLWPSQPIRAGHVISRPMRGQWLLSHGAMATLWRRLGLGGSPARVGGPACRYMISPPLLLLTNTRCDTSDSSLAAPALVRRRITQFTQASTSPLFSSSRWVQDSGLNILSRFWQYQSKFLGALLVRMIMWIWGDGCQKAQ